MIIPIMAGGLGNQMFQIACAYSLAKDNNDEVAINYSIPHKGLQKSHINYKHTLYRNIAEGTITPSYTYIEPHFHYHPISYVKDMAIDGYFQSEKYFEKYREALNSLFQFPDNIVEKVNEVMNQLGNVYKVAIHYRRGDYLQYKHIHPCLQSDYYKRCKMNFQNKDVLYINFSDDVNCVLNEMNVEGKVIKSNNELFDLCMMSQCDSIIMSNSSFAWWGAYLGKKKDIICMPKIWFGDGFKVNHNDIYIKGSIIV